MTTEQLLYVASRIHDWDKSPSEIVKRAMSIVENCETAERAYNDFEDMLKRGLSPDEMRKEAAKTAASMSL